MTDPMETSDESAHDRLPPWTSVLAVVAHPDDESFGLGGVLDAFARGGAAVDVLCLTHGEASTLHGVGGDLLAVRESELTAAADLLGVSHAWLRNHRDGALGDVDPEILTGAVLDVARDAVPQGLLVFDTTGITGHPDHVAASAAAVRASEALDIPVLGWTVPASVAAQLNHELGSGFVGRPPEEIDLEVTVDRSRQLSASRAHASQALPESVLWRRLELLGDTESLRWLRRGAGPPAR